MNPTSFAFKNNILFEKIKEHKADGILLQDQRNLFWYTGIKNLTGFCLVTIKKNYLLVDQRYFFEIKNKLNNFTIIKYLSIDDLIVLLRKTMVKKILIESDYLTLEKFQIFFSLIKQKLNITLLNFSSKFIRVLKTDDEIKLMRKSAMIATNCINWVKTKLKIGVTEMEIRNLILKYWNENNCDGPSFSPIVAFGKNSAIPHHEPTNKKLGKNEIVKLDIGCIYHGYCSDITRTFLMGNKEAKKIYDIVLKANLMAIKSIKVNKSKISDVDLSARNIIKNAGYGKYFTHYTSHGLGIEIHEKVTNHNNLENLKNNMVFTIEPGIYLPNKFGIRIEDMILIKNNKIFVLTKNAKK